MDTIILTLLIIGVICLAASFFIGKRPNDELEHISISLHNETNQLAKRLKVVEEELMIGIGTMPSEKQSGHIHEIIVNQILSLHHQGYSLHEISARASLSEQDVISVLHARGVRL